MRSLEMLASIRLVRFFDRQARLEGKIPVISAALLKVGVDYYTSSQIAKSAS